MPDLSANRVPCCCKLMPDKKLLLLLLYFAVLFYQPAPAQTSHDPKPVNPFERLLFVTENLLGDTLQFAEFQHKSHQFKKKEQWDSSAYYINQAALLYFKQVKHQRVQKILTNYLNELPSKADTLHGSYLDLLITMAISTELTYDYQASLHYMQRAVNLADRLEGLSPAFRGLLYSHMSYTYSFFKDSRAMDYIKKAGSILHKLGKYEYLAMYDADVSYFYVYAQRDVALFYARLGLACYERAGYKSPEVRRNLLSALSLAAFRYDNKLALESAQEVISAIKKTPLF